jgi:hypothetical protein
MSAATSGACASVWQGPGYRCAHPGYRLAEIHRHQLSFVHRQRSPSDCIPFSKNESRLEESAPNNP